MCDKEVHMEGKWIYPMIIFLLVCLSGTLYLMDRRQEEMVIEVAPLEISEESEDVSRATPLQGVVVVYLTGAVMAPGIYEMAEGSRLYELIEAAGGMSETADAVGLNLARFLFDGEMIRVPTAEETAAGGSEEGHDAQGVKISINRAGAKELMSLTGIGEARAEAIIAYRNKNGPFVRIEDIMKVEGIKDAMFNKIKDDISI